MMRMAELSNLQIELLRLYRNGVSDETLCEVKSILAHYFAEQASNAMDEEWDTKGLTEQDMIDWTNGHDRSKNSHPGPR